MEGNNNNSKREAITEMQKNIKNGVFMASLRELEDQIHVVWWFQRNRGSIVSQQKEQCDVQVD